MLRTDSRQLPFPFRERGTQRPEAVFPEDGLAVCEISDQVRHKKRMTLSTSVDLCPKIFRELVFGKLQGKVAVNLHNVQATKIKVPALVSRLEVELYAKERVSGQSKFRFAVCGDHEESVAIKLTGQIRNRINSGNIGPVEIIKKDDKLALAGKGLKKSAQLALHELGRAAGRMSADYCRGQIFVCRGKAQVPIWRDQFQDAGYPARPIRREQAIYGAQHWEIRFAACCEFRAAAAPHKALFRTFDYFTQEVFNERRLTQTGFARYAKQQSASRPGVGESRNQFLAF